MHGLELTTPTEKNRILKKDSQKQSTPKVIPKPKGSIGQKGYSLIKHMGLNPDEEEEKGLYSNVLVS
jgi:hypothetical protein